MTTTKDEDEDAPWWLLTTACPPKQRIGQHVQVRFRLKYKKDTSTLHTNHFCSNINAKNKNQIDITT